MLKGGLIHQIPESKLGLSRPKENIPKLANELVKFMCFSDNRFITHNSFRIYGSFVYRLQSYPGDIDSSNLITYKLDDEEAAKDIVLQLKVIVRKLLANRLNRFYSDLKAGVYENGEGIHWKAHEVLQGYRDIGVPDINGHVTNKLISLYDAVQEKDKLLKLDMLALYDGKYVEVSCLYEIKTNSGPLSYMINRSDTKFLDTIIAVDTGKQLKKGNKFKVIKRIYSNAKIRKDVKVMKLVEPLINSNLSKLSSLKSDISTLKLLIETGQFPNLDVFNSYVEKLKFGLDNILDIDLPHNNIYKSLSNLHRYIQQKNKPSSIHVLDSLETLFDDVLNKETMKFLNSIGVGFKDFSKKYIA